MALIEREIYKCDLDTCICNYGGECIAADTVKARCKYRDAASVVHGQWRRTPMSDTLFCSACDEIQLGREETPFCPLCGARMGGEGNEAD